MEGDDESDGGSNNVGAIAQAVAAVAKEVPVYQDLAQPAARELGKTLHTTARVINALAFPLRFTAWSLEQIEEFVKSRVLPKLVNTPEADLQTPALHIGVPLLEALRYTGSDPELSELYANLLANSMDANTASKAHPAFVDIIKAMTPDEAKIMRLFAITGQSAPLVDVRMIMKRRLFRQDEFQTVMRNFSLIGYQAECKEPLSAASYIDNLARLGLLNVDRQKQKANAAEYDAILQSPPATAVIERVRENKLRVEFGRCLVELTEFGKLFIETCVSDKGELKPAPRDLG